MQRSFILSDASAALGNTDQNLIPYFIYTDQYRNGGISLP